MATQYIDEEGQKDDNQYKVLRIRASEVAVCAGLHPYNNVIEAFEAHLYQGLQHMLKEDAHAMSLEIVDQADHFDALVLKTGKDIAADLTAARREAYSERVRTTRDASKVRAKVDIAIARAVEAERVTAVEASQLREALMYDLHTEFGKRHEDEALGAYERLTGREVNSRNDWLLRWGFPPNPAEAQPPCLLLSGAARGTRSACALVKRMRSVDKLCRLLARMVGEPSSREETMGEVVVACVGDVRCEQAVDLDDDAVLGSLQPVRRVAVCCTTDKDKTIIIRAAENVSLVVEELAKDGTIILQVQKRIESTVVDVKPSEEATLVPLMSPSSDTAQMDLWSAPAAPTSQQEVPLMTENTDAATEHLQSVGAQSSDFRTGLRSAPSTSNNVSAVAGECMGDATAASNDSNAEVTIIHQSGVEERATGCRGRKRRRHESRDTDAYFEVVGIVDGITEDLDASADDPVDWVLKPMVVEVKNRTRVENLRDPPELYDQLQAVVYMLMLGCDSGDFVQRVKGGGNDYDSADRLLVSRIALDGPPMDHRKAFFDHVVPRLYHYVALIYRMRADADLRRKWLGSEDAEKWAFLRQELPYLDGSLWLSKPRGAMRTGVALLPSVTCLTTKARLCAVESGVVLEEENVGSNGGHEEAMEVEVLSSSDTIGASVSSNVSVSTPPRATRPVTRAMAKAVATFTAVASRLTRVTRTPPPPEQPEEDQIRSSASRPRSSGGRRSVSGKRKTLSAPVEQAVISPQKLITEFFSERSKKPKDG